MKLCLTFKVSLSCEDTTFCLTQMAGQTLSYNTGNIPDSIAQKVRITPGHTYQVLIDSKNAIKGNAYNFSFNSGFDSESISRLIPSSIHAYLSMPNINQMNNEVIFTFAATPAINRVCVVPIGYYTDQTYFTALATAMSAFGAAFVYAYNPNTQTHALTCAVSTFRFEDCLMNRRGIYTMDLPVATAYANTQTILSAPMFYTPVIYVQASRLVPNDGNLSYTAGDTKFDYFTSIYLEYPDVRHVKVGNASQFANSQYTTRSDKTMSSFSIRLLDVFGEPIEQWSQTHTSDFFIMIMSLVS